MAAASGIDIAQLVVSALTPLLIFVLGIILTRAQWMNRKVIERRLDLFNEMAPLINDLFCFFARVGHFQDVTPPVALGRKRELDRLFYTNAHIFGRDFRIRYERFMNTCFQTYVGAGKDARLRTSATDQRAERRAWDPAWDDMFAVASGQTWPEIMAAHDDLMEMFAREVGARSSLRG